MAEYINRQAAITIPVMPKRYRKYQTMNLDDAYEDGWDDALKCIEKIPPADVRPVVRGEWEHDNWGFDYDRCSVCGYEHRWPGPFYFCPNCGADMRSEKEDKVS